MKRRYRRTRHNGFRRKHQDYRRRRNNGWGMGLYRNTRDGKIAGVCAGLADHWGVERWVVRLLAIVAFLFTGALAFWAYVAGWIMLAPRRRVDDYEHRWDDPVEEYEEEVVEMEYDEYQHDYRPRKMFRYGESTSVRLQRARERLDAAMQRVADMESYVTSRQFQLNKKISEL